MNAYSNALMRERWALKDDAPLMQPGHVALGSVPACAWCVRSCAVCVFWSVLIGYTSNFKLHSTGRFGIIVHPHSVPRRRQAQAPTHAAAYMLHVFDVIVEPLYLTKSTGIAHTSSRHGAFLGSRGGGAALGAACDLCHSAAGPAAGSATGSVAGSAVALPPAQPRPAHLPPLPPAQPRAQSQEAAGSAAG